MTDFDWRDYRRMAAKEANRQRRRASAAGVSIDIDDLMSEAMLTFVRARDGFRDDAGAQFSTYLWTALRQNLGRWTQAQIRARMPERSLDAVLTTDDEDGSLHDLLSDDGEDALDRVERIERRDATLAALSPTARAVVGALDAPGPLLVAELRRVEWFSGYAVEQGCSRRNAKIDLNFICNAAGLRAETRKSVVAELRRCAFGE